MTYVTRTKMEDFGQVKCDIPGPLLQLPGLRAAEFSSEPHMSKATFTFEKVLKQMPNGDRARRERELFQSKLVPPLGMQKAEYWMNLMDGWNQGTSKPQNSSAGGPTASSASSGGSGTTSTGKISVTHAAFQQHLGGGVGLKPPSGIDITSGATSVANSRTGSKTRAIPGDFQLKPLSFQTEFQLKPLGATSSGFRPALGSRQTNLATAGSGTLSPNKGSQLTTGGGPGASSSSPPKMVTALPYKKPTRNMQSEKPLFQNAAGREFTSTVQRNVLLNQSASFGALPSDSKHEPATPRDRTTGMTGELLSHSPTVEFLLNPRGIITEERKLAKGAEVIVSPKPLLHSPPFKSKYGGEDGERKIQRENMFLERERRLNIVGASCNYKSLLNHG
ncbi:unnamed protein product [Amoebophrya sp. A25]|nr:unnamed protein product [Amoebophrya sp. A25]|eukprot:GSA25T00005712001.1